MKYNHFSTNADLFCHLNKTPLCHKVELARIAPWHRSAALGNVPVLFHTTAQQTKVQEATRAQNQATRDLLKKTRNLQNRPRATGRQVMPGMEAKKECNPLPEQLQELKAADKARGL